MAIIIIIILLFMHTKSVFTGQDNYRHTPWCVGWPSLSPPETRLPVPLASLRTAPVRHSWGTTSSSPHQSGHWPSPPRPGIAFCYLYQCILINQYQLLKNWATMTKSHSSVYFFKIMSAGILIIFFFKIIVTFPGCPSEHRKFPIKENSGLSMVSRIHPPSYKTFQMFFFFV